MIPFNYNVAGGGHFLSFSLSFKWWTLRMFLPFLPRMSQTNKAPRRVNFWPLNALAHPPPDVTSYPPIAWVVTAFAASSSGEKSGNIGPEQEKTQITEAPLIGTLHLLVRNLEVKMIVEVCASHTSHIIVPANPCMSTRRNHLFGHEETKGVTKREASRGQ